MTVIWQRKGLNEGFEFINEKEAARCGCGESFTI
jgi:iron-sulfur cluster assembly protein